MKYTGNVILYAGLFLICLFIFSIMDGRTDGHIITAFTFQIITIFCCFTTYLDFKDELSISSIFRVMRIVFLINLLLSFIVLIGKSEIHITYVLPLLMLQGAISYRSLNKMSGNAEYGTNLPPPSGPC